MFYYKLFLLLSILPVLYSSLELRSGAHYYIEFYQKQSKKNGQQLQDLTPEEESQEPVHISLDLDWALSVTMPLWKGGRDDGAELNRAVLVSVAHFDPGVNLGKRPGANKDTRRLHRTLSRLGFKVDIHTDPSSEEIYTLFEKGNTLVTHTLDTMYILNICYRVSTVPFFAFSIHRYSYG